MSGCREDKGLDLSRLNVLIVDENRFMRSLLKGLFHSFGVKNLREATDGADAFKELRVFSADLITTELVMSPLDGIDFMSLIRRSEDSPLRTVPIIAVTAFTERHMIERARDAGVDEFLAKPITAEVLYHRLKGVLQFRRPFIRTHGYVGPDRRRHSGRPFRGPERRQRQSGEVIHTVSPLERGMLEQMISGDDF